MSLVGTLRRFIGTRAASTVTAAQATPAAPPAPEAAPSIEELRQRAKRVYKELHRLGRDYPDENYNFNMRLRRAFEKNKNIDDPVKLKQQLELAEHIKKEILAMYSIRKYRGIRSRHCKRVQQKC